VVGVGTQAHAERRSNVDAIGAQQGSCSAAAGRLTQVLSVDGQTKTALANRCQADRWSRDTTLCFSQISSSTEGALCLDTLSKTQRKSVEGDADRLADARLSRWLMRRTLTTATSTPVVVTLASYNTGPETTMTSENAGTVRMLRTKGMSAYQAGRYEAATKSLSAAMTASPTADNVYFAAQAYRMKGERAKALELYERYLEIAPNGPAGPACRYQIERLRDSIP